MHVSRRPFEECPLCDGTTAIDLGVADLTIHEQWRDDLPTATSWLECGDCGHVFTAEWWTQQGRHTLRSRPRSGTSLAEMWNDARAWGDAVIQFATGAVDRVRDVLVVGASACAGGIVAVAAEHGFRVVGIDDRVSVVSELQAYGLDVRDGEQIEWAALGAWDVVVVDDVLARAPWPRLLLEDLAPCVAPDGALVVSFVNRGAYAWRHADETGTNGIWAEVEYHHLFDRESVSRMLVDAGYTPKQWQFSRSRRFGLEVIATRSAPHA